MLSILSRFWFFVAFSAVQLCSWAQAPSDYALLWRISKPGTGISGYLFGTMHDNGEEAYQFSDSVLVAFDRCTMAAFELNHDSLTEALMTFVAQLDKQRDQTSAAKSQIFKRVRMEVSTPTVAEAPEPRTSAKQEYPQQHLDHYLQMRALSIRIPLKGLENAEDQMHMLLHFTDTLNYERMLTDSLYYQQHLPYLKALVSGKIMDRSIPFSLKTAYAKGDLSAIEQIMAQYEKGGLQLSERNKAMLPKIQALLEQERLFVAVGAAHLAGDEGLITLLRAKGYTVEKVPATFTGMAAAKLALPLRKKQWIEWKNDQIGIRLMFPSSPTKVENTEVWISLDLDALRSYGATSQIFMPKEDHQNAVEDHLRLKLEHRGLKEVSKVSKRKVSSGYAAEATARLDGNYVYYTVEWHHDRLYTFFVTAAQPIDAKDPDVRYFLSNIACTPVVVENLLSAESKEYRNEHGGFRVNYAGQFKENRIEEVVDAQESASPEVIYLTTFTIPKSSDQILVRFSDAPKGRYFNDREEVFSAINSNFESMRELPNCVLTSCDTIIGSIAWRCTKARFLGTENITLCYLRGTRIYVLAFSGGERSARSFWEMVDSFEFLPLASSPMAHTDEFGIRTPVEMIKERVDDLEDITLPIDFLEVKQCTDTLSSAIYNVIRYHLHPGFATRDVKRWVQEVGARLVEEDVLRNESGETQDKVEMLSEDSVLYHARITSPRNDLLIEVKTFALGRDLVLLQNIRPAEQVTDANAEAFLSTGQLKALSDSSFESGNALELIAALPYAALDDKGKMMAVAEFIEPADLGYNAFAQVLNHLYEKPGTEDVGELSWMLEQLIALDTLQALSFIQKWVTVKKNEALYDAASYKMSFVTHPQYMRFYLTFLNGLECPSQESSLLALWWNSYDLLTMVEEMKTHCRKGNQCMMDYLAIVISNNTDSVLTKNLVDDEILEWTLAAANRARNGALEMKDTEQVITPQDVLYHTTRVLSVRTDAPKVVAWLHGLLDSSMPLQVRAEAIKPLLLIQDKNIASALDALLSNDHTGFDLKFWAHSNGVWNMIPERHQDPSAYCRQYLQYVIDQEAEGDTENAVVKSAGSTSVKTNSGDKVFYHCTVQWQGEEGEDAYSFGPLPIKGMTFDLNEQFYLVSREGYSSLKKALDGEAKKMAEQLGQFED